jgi:hypothetical protein
MRHGVKINLASIYNQQDILLWKSSYRRSTNVAANRYSTAPGANDATTAKKHVIVGFKLFPDYRKVTEYQCSTHIK